MKKSPFNTAVSFWKDCESQSLILFLFLFNICVTGNMHLKGMNENDL